ncbi:MAG: Subtilase family [Fibrobacteria bacterium]|nr:Subtilase family [Fibrobacteria bacterium]
MTKQYILIKAFVLMAGWGAVGFSQSDTTVLNQTEFRFPETHPGEVFLVKKVILSPKGSLPKSAAVEASPSPSVSPEKTSAPLANRDLRGRFTQGGEYQKRMEQIRRKHGLPTLSASVQEAGRPFKVPKNFRMPEGSRMAVTSNSPRIRSGQDLVALERAEREAVRRKYGALSPEFSRQVDAMKEGEEVEVSIELAIESPGYLNGMKATPEGMKANARAWTSAKTRVNGESLLRQHGLRRTGPEKAETGRVMHVKATRGQIRSLAHAAGVVSVSRRIPSKTASIPGNPPVLEDLLASAYNPAGDMAFYTGMNAATLERGLRPAFVDSLPVGLKPISYRLENFVGWDPAEAAHSEATYLVMARGAPGSDHHHLSPYASGGYFSDVDDSITNYEMTSISTSYVGTWNSTIYPDSRFVDNFAYVYPYPVFSFAAGNDGHEHVPLAQTYNALIVGNVQHYENSHYIVDYLYDGGAGPVVVPNSRSKNPAARYGSSADREMPSLIAPGHTPFPGWGICDEYILVTGGYLGKYWCPGGGTSFSAPVTAALAANVRSARGGYNIPVKAVETRAALLVTAENVDSGYWNPSVQDSRDGAGTVSGARAVEFAANAQYTELFPYGDPVQTGLVSDYLDSAYFDQGGFIERYYKYQVPQTIPSGKHLRVVLTWTSSPSLSTAENEISDLGLYVNDDNGWVGSDTWESNVEIVDIDNGALTPGQDYYIWVHPGTYRKSDGGPDLFYYTVAWTWVKDHAD